MSGADDKDALLVRDAPGRKARVLVGRIHGLEFNFRFGDLLLTCELRDGGPAETVQLSLATEDVELLLRFLKRAKQLFEPCGTLFAAQFHPGPDTPGPRPKPIFWFEQEPGTP